MRLRALLVVVLAAGAFAGGAGANGDPASDVLPFYTVYFAGQNPDATPSGRDLLFLTRQAMKKKFPIRVAVIYQPSDLGLIQSLWKQPQSYARFLGKELINFGRYHGTLLVSMPNGYGVFGPGATAPSRRALSSLASPGTVGLDRFGAATVSAVQALATASGHALPAPPKRGSGTPAWVILLAALTGPAVLAGTVFLGLRRWLTRA